MFPVQPSILRRQNSFLNAKVKEICPVVTRSVYGFARSIAISSGLKTFFVLIGHLHHGNLYHTGVLWVNLLSNSWGTVYFVYSGTNNQS